MDLGVLIEGLGVRLLGAGDGAISPAVCKTRICDVTEDSRTVVPGSLFVARGGLKADGKKHVADAIANGAVAVLTDSLELKPDAKAVPLLYAVDVMAACATIAERFYRHPSQHLKLALVTGTNGKTTTTTLIWRILNGISRRCGLVGTVLVDDGAEVAAANMTTPPSIELSRTLQVMVDSGCEGAAIEASSHALDQRRVDALKIDVAVFTNLSGDHLDYHGTMEAYLAAKARLFTLLAPSGVAIINADDPSAEKAVAVVADRKDIRVLRCRSGREGAADCRVEILEFSIDGMRLSLAGPWGSIEVSVPMIGTYNAMNVLQASASAWSMVRVTRDELERGLSKIVAPTGRLEPVSEKTDTVKVFVDYAHSDDSLTRMLEALSPLVPGRDSRGAAKTAFAGTERRSQPHGRLWVVFGCGGDRDKTKRPRMGKAAATLADVVVVTSDNPRTEKPTAIIDEILTGIARSQRDKVTVQADRESAIKFAIENAREGDVVVIAGKGHETEQILADGKGGTYSIHFDDREIAKAALEARRPMVEIGKPKTVVSKSRTGSVSRWGRV
jgi:UDP-N-acetylmuramoyl-L-alanyl-D-glutamate--2,6-diaminopimelate ligase